jgi:hypothetical protein
MATKVILKKHTIFFYVSIELHKINIRLYLVRSVNVVSEREECVRTQRHPFQLLNPLFTLSLVNKKEKKNTVLLTAQIDRYLLSSGLHYCSNIWIDSLPFMVGQMIVYTDECQRCYIISTYSAGHSSAVYGVHTGGIQKQTWVSNNMILCPLMIKKKKKLK